MAIVENRESIKRRLQSEAARQWGVNESGIKDGSFDPIVNLLFGALSVESEKIWHEMEASRSRVVKRMVETVLPEVVTGMIPAHSVMSAKPSFGSGEVIPTDQFYNSGNDAAYFSPAGSFKLSGATVHYIASGTKIDKAGVQYQREPVIRLSGDKSIAPQTCWIGIEPPADPDTDELVLFINWASIADRAKFLSYTGSMQFFYGKDTSPAGRPIPVSGSSGIEISDNKIPDFPAGYEKTVRDYYYPHFITLNNLPLDDKRQLKNYPDEWESILELPEKALFYQELFWVKLVIPASINPEGLDRMEIALNCFPVMNRKHNRQRGKLQPLFNVYALTDESGFLGIEKVLNGDGEELLPVNQKDLNKDQNVYTLRKGNVARFDQRDAFESLTDLTAHMRDDLAAFNALDNSILNNHLETINKGVLKLREHLDSFQFQLPLIYLLVRTKSLGNMLDVHFWSSLGSQANGLAAQTRLIAESSNSFKSDTALLMLPSTGGRDPMDDEQMQKAFKEAILTRGKAVTLEDFRTITRGIAGSFVKNVEVKKGLSIGEGSKEGIRRILEVNIVPESAQRQSEEYWLKQAQQVKNTLEQRSTGVMPLFVSVQGYNWKI